MLKEKNLCGTLQNLRGTLRNLRRTLRNLAEPLRNLAEPSQNLAEPSQQGKSLRKPLRNLCGTFAEPSRNLAEPLTVFSNKACLRSPNLQPKAVRQPVVCRWSRQAPADGVPASLVLPQSEKQGSPSIRFREGSARVPQRFRNGFLKDFLC